jgi:hypothetical protein
MKFSPGLRMSSCTGGCRSQPRSSPFRNPDVQPPIFRRALLPYGIKAWVVVVRVSPTPNAAAGCLRSYHFEKVRRRSNMLGKRIPRVIGTPPKYPQGTFAGKFENERSQTIKWSTARTNPGQMPVHSTQADNRSGRRHDRTSCSDFDCGSCPAVSSSGRGRCYALDD